MCNKSDIHARFYRPPPAWGAPLPKLFPILVHLSNKAFRQEKLREVKLPIGTAFYSGFNGAALEEQQQGFGWMTSVRVRQGLSLIHT